MRMKKHMTIPEGGQIVQAGEGYFIVNAECNPVAYVSSPWAKDANGVIGTIGYAGGNCT